MRESIGATWIFSICLTFIVLFTAYLAISVNYAKAFRIKNHIVTRIEENEGYNSGLEADLSTYLIAQGYSAYSTCPDYSSDEKGSWEKVGCVNPQNGNENQCGACIYRVESNSHLGQQSYYRVVSFFKFDLPVISYITTFKIKGESKLINDFAYNS